MADMREELHRYLDGEIGKSGLPPDLAREAAAWDDLLDDVRQSAVSRAPAGLEQSVLWEIAREKPSAWLRARAWLLRPRLVSISPAAGFAVVVVLLFVGLLPWLRVGGTPADAETVYVQLFLEAPAATSVALAGDFNGWVPTIELEDPDDDGVWSGRLAVQPGIYEYMYVLDGTRWMTDPHAEWYSDDGFGNRNAVLAVMPPSDESDVTSSWQ